MSISTGLTGKTALVTGGSGVLCGAIAEALGREGASVAVLSHSRLALAEAVADTICDQGGCAAAFSGDVLDKNDLVRLRHDIEETFGPVEILINGAGGARKDATTSATLSFYDLPEEAVRWVFDLNFMGTFLPCQVFGERMVSEGRGRILNIASLGAFQPLTRSVAYSAAKASVVNFTQWLAVHMSQEYDAQITVNALVPGFFLTEQNRFLLMNEGDEGLTERGARIVGHTPMGRLGRAEDLVAPALAMLSDGFGFVHGTTLVVDGGISAFGGV